MEIKICKDYSLAFIQFSQFNMGGEVPLEYYLSKTAEPKDYYESFSIVAGAGGKKKMKFNVDRVGSIFR